MVVTVNYKVKPIKDKRSQATLYVKDEIEKNKPKLWLHKR